MCNDKSWKDLTKRMVDKAGHRKDVAKALGVSDNDLSQWCNEGHTRVIPLDHAADLSALADDILLKDLARRRGFELTPIDRKPIDIETAEEATADLAKDTGVLVHDMFEASQHVISPRVQREIRALKGQVYNDLEALP